MRSLLAIARGMTRASSAMSMPKITALHTRSAFVGLDFCACGTFQHITAAIFYCSEIRIQSLQAFATTTAARSTELPGAG